MILASLAVIFLVVGVSVLGYRAALALKERRRKREREKIQERANVRVALDSMLRRNPKDPELIALKDSFERAEKEESYRNRRKIIGWIDGHITDYLRR